MTSDRQLSSALRLYGKRAWARLRVSAWHIALACLAVAVAVAISTYVLHHAYPFLAATSAWICLGFTEERRVRKVVEIAVGVSLGVALGELAIQLLGHGIWQVALALFVVACLTRFLDGGRMIVTQAGVQCMYIALVPQVQGGVFARVLDSVVGASVAILVALLIARDPSKSQRETAHKFLREMREILTELSLACSEGSPPLAATALARARRSSQTLTNAWADANSTADEVSKFSPVARRHGVTVQRLQKMLGGADKAMRNLRVIARRTNDMLDSASTLPGGTAEAARQRITFSKIGEVLQEFSDIVAEMDRTLERAEDLASTRPRLQELAERLQPVNLVPHAKQPGLNALIHSEAEVTNTQGIAIPPMTVWHGQTLVLLLRSILVDLLEATGLTNDEARAMLPDLARV
ncbi:FUSC family protein [Micrococcales bacterium 31B]|nr:FUSC family protein [Micrococcales bacterium 31B]